jgi:uncharacterized protein with beta-barrel porin domain
MYKGGWVLTAMQKNRGIKMTKKLSLKNKLVITTTLAAAFVGYGRRAYAVAGPCAYGTLGTPHYDCSSLYTSTRLFTAYDADVYTSASIDITTSLGDAVDIHTAGALSFTDTHASTITGSQKGIYIGVLGDNGYTPGSVTISADGPITGIDDSAIVIQNDGTGDIEINASGDVIGFYNGITANNHYGSNNLDIAVGKVTGAIGSGIFAKNYGTGRTTITADGDVYGNNDGISVVVSGVGTYLSVTTAAGHTVTGTNKRGIYVSSVGGSDITVDAYGDVTGSTAGIWTSTFGDINITTGDNSVIANTKTIGTNQGINQGISAATHGGTLVITTGANSTVIGRGSVISSGIYATSASTALTTGTGSAVLNVSGYGILASTTNTGDLSVTVGGVVLSGNVGVKTLNTSTKGGDLTIITGENSAVISTNSQGIYALNSSTISALAIDIGANGAVTGNSTGIDARNSGSDLDITVGKFGMVTGITTDGISAKNSGSGELTIATDGSVTSSRRGLYASNSLLGTNLDITVGENSAITGGSLYGIEARNFGAGTLTVTADGKVTGGVRGIYAHNFLSDTTMSITTGANSLVKGSNDSSSYGIWARNSGGGDLAINAAGDAIGAAQGIHAHSSGSGELSIIVDGNVTGGYSGIFARADGADLLITAQEDAIVSGGIGIYVAGDAIASGSIDTSGTIKGLNGTAIFLTNLAATMDITLNGGHIIGDVVDDNPSNGYSQVTIADDFTSAGSFDISDFSVSKSATFTLSGGNQVDAANQLDNKGTLAISAGATVTADTMSASTGTLSFGVASKSDHGLLTVSGGPADLTNQTITVNVTGAGLANNDQILIIDGLGTIKGTPGGTATPVADNSALWDFDIIDGTGVATPTGPSDLYLIATQVSDQITTENNNNVVQQLIDLGNSTTDPLLLSIVDSINGASTPEELNRILDSVQPPADAGATVSTLTFIDVTTNLTSARLENLRADNGTTGMSAGNAAPNTRVWFQASGQSARQDIRGGIDGFKSTLAAGTIGMDTNNIFENGILGMALSFGKSHVDSQNANRTDTDIDSYQVTFYSDYDLSRGFYVNGMASGAVNHNTTLRHDVDLTPGLNAAGDFNSHQFAARAEGGRVFSMGSFTFTPMALVNWVYYKADDYIETGAGSADLNVSTQDLQQVDLGLGAKIAGHFGSAGDARYVPEIHGNYRREMIGDRLETTSVFTGGGPAFSGESPIPARNKFNLGAQFKYSTVDNVELTASYDFDTKQDFTSHAGMLRVGYKF